MEPETQRVLWTPEEPEKRAGEAPDAFLLRQAAQHPPLPEDLPTELGEGLAGLSAQELGALLALNDLVLAVDEAEAAPLWRVPFEEIARRYAAGEITQPVYLAYCRQARVYRPQAMFGGFFKGAPPWTQAPCCVWEAWLLGKTPNDMRQIAELGLMPSDDVMADYRQVWRRSVPRYSDNWIEEEHNALRPRAAEALALFANPVRRAPIEDQNRKLFEARRWAGTYGPRQSPIAIAPMVASLDEAAYEKAKRRK